MPATSASAATSGSACLAAMSGAHVHFLVDPSGSGEPEISGLSITGFDAGSCDGLPVVVTLSGNTAGDPSKPADHLLTTLDSTLDQCSGAKLLGGAVTISGGAITLHGCAGVSDPDAAAYASIHDVTKLTLTVAGVDVPVVVDGISTGPGASTPPPSSGAATTPGSPASQSVAGVQATHSAGHGASGQGGSNTGPLASTGVRVALLTVIGLVLLSVGAFLLVAGKRRRAQHAD